MKSTIEVNKLIKEINSNYQLFDKVIGIRYKGYFIIFKDKMFLIYKEIFLANKKNYDLKFIKQVSNKKDIIEEINILNLNE